VTFSSPLPRAVPLCFSPPGGFWAPPVRPFFLPSQPMVRSSAFFSGVFKRPCRWPVWGVLFFLHFLLSAAFPTNGTPPRLGRLTEFSLWAASRPFPPPSTRPALSLRPLHFLSQAAISFFAAQLETDPLFPPFLLMRDRVQLLLSPADASPHHEISFHRCKVECDSLFFLSPNSRLFVSDWASAALPFLKPADAPPFDVFGPPNRHFFPSDSRVAPQFFSPSRRTRGFLRRRTRRNTL